MFIKEKSTMIAVWCCIIAACLWGLLWYPIRVLEQIGVPGIIATFYIYLVASLFVLKPCWQRRKELLKHKWDYFLLAMMSGWTNLAFILAVLEGEVVRVLLLIYLSPIWAILLARVILNEKLTVHGLIALVLAIPGAIVMLWSPDFFSKPIQLSDFYALSAGMSFALYNILVRKIGQVHWSLKLGTSWLGVLILCIAGMVMFTVPSAEFSLLAVAIIVILGFPVIYIMTFTAQYGATHLPIQRSTIIFLLEIVVGAVSAAFLTNEVITAKEYIGGTLIVLAGLISVAAESSADHRS